LGDDRGVIRVMADYDSYPLWRRDEDGTANLDPSYLRVSQELADELMRWADDYDRTLNREDPISSGFPDAAVESEFVERGRRLAGRLAAEVGDRYVVEYAEPGQ
jgi:hypothetical protein